MRLYVPNTAVLLFIRDEKEEAKLKNFSPRQGRAGNRRVIQELNRYALDIAHQTNLPVFVCTGDEQRGATFGEKLANATEDIFQQGYNKLITIGNDCLSLTADDLLLANEELSTNELVLGPTPEGGVYLIGLNKAAYERKQFLELRWESSYLFHDFCTTISTDAVAILATKADANTAEALNKAIQQLPVTNYLVRRLGQLLYIPTCRSVLHEEAGFFSNLTTSQIYFRGPPH